MRKTPTGVVYLDLGIVLVLVVVLVLDSVGFRTSKRGGFSRDEHQNEFSTWGSRLTLEFRLWTCRCRTAGEICYHRV